MLPVSLLVELIIPLAALVFVILVARSVLMLSRDDPAIWEADIRRFEVQDRRAGLPTGIIVFTGSSSIRFWTTLSAEVAAAYRQFCEKVHAALPEAPIYFISIKPPKARVEYWPAMQAANQLVREYCTADPRRRYMDIVPAMLDANGHPRRDIFKWDG